MAPAQAEQRRCVKVFMKSRSTRSQRVEVRALLERTDPEAKTRFVSSREALRRLERQSPDLVHDLPYNPLPASFEVSASSRDAATRILDVMDPPPAGVDSAKAVGRFGACPFYDDKRRIGG